MQILGVCKNMHLRPKRIFVVDEFKVNLCWARVLGGCSGRKGRSSRAQPGSGQKPSLDHHTITPLHTDVSDFGSKVNFTRKDRQWYLAITMDPSVTFHKTDIASSDMKIHRSCLWMWTRVTSSNLRVDRNLHLQTSPPCPGIWDREERRQWRIQSGETLLPSLDKQICLVQLCKNCLFPLSCPYNT